MISTISRFKISRFLGFRVSRSQDFNVLVRFTFSLHFKFSRFQQASNACTTFRLLERHAHPNPSISRPVELVVVLLERFEPPQHAESSKYPQPVWPINGLIRHPMNLLQFRYWNRGLGNTQEQVRFGAFIEKETASKWRILQCRNKLRNLFRKKALWQHSEAP